MCGISGGFNISPKVVEQMVGHQVSRGPDNAATVQIGKVVFGHNRLKIIDQSEAGNQPLRNAHGLLVYSGELYNFQNPEFSSDTAWLLDSLGSLDQDSTWESKLNRLNGMFAFAYYDEQEQTVTIVRDRFGIKPLYYYHSHNIFAFASTPAALSLVKSDWQVSQQGILEYLSLGATQIHSLFEGIVQVPPGHYVTFNCVSQEARITRWYYPGYVRNALFEIEERVARAIDRVKLSCDWPQILLLSGGIDSSLVAAQNVGQSAIHLRSPEQQYAEQVAKKFDIKLLTADSQNSNAEADLTDYIAKSGDPTMAGLIPYIACKEIAKNGYRVAISANGADELFFGYDRTCSMDPRVQIEHIFRPFAPVPIPPPIKLNAPKRWLEINTYLAHDLNKTLDFASMCHSVEVRVPYLDHELVEAALSISQSDHVSQFGKKTILKRMLNKLGFDRQFIDRPKVGFSLHYFPPDWVSLGDKALSWYRSSHYPQLSTGNSRHNRYHRNTVIGLYLWHKIFPNCRGAGGDIMALQEGYLNSSESFPV